MKTIILIAIIAVFVAPAIASISIILNLDWGRGLWHQSVNKHYRKDKIKYNNFIWRVKKEPWRFIRFTYFVSLFFIWGYVLFVIRYMCVWIWKQI